MGNLRGGLIGCGFFARNHLNGWREVRGAEIAAVCDVDAARAREYAGEWEIPGVYTDPETMLREAGLDFVDVVTQPASHRSLVELAARHGKPVVCQKPLAFALEDARAMVEACRAAGVPLMVHENFRWQAPMRAVKAAAAALGPLAFGRISWRTGEDIYANQPYLAEEPRLVIADMGVHVFDLARFFLGEVRQLNCQAARVNPRVRGEDQATALLRMASGAACVVEMSYGSWLADDPFPQTLVHLEGERGTAALGADYRLAVKSGDAITYPDAGPREFAWSVPRFAAVQESVLNAQQHWADCLREGREPETSGADNLKTLELVHAAYVSAETGEPYRLA